MRFVEKLYFAFTRMLYARKINGGDDACFAYTGGARPIVHPQAIWIGRGFFAGKDFLLAVYENLDTETVTGKLEIGNNVIMQQRVRISCIESVKIGENVLLASNILITDNNHGTNAGSNIPYCRQKNIAKKVSIGDGCWIGENVVILPGTTIGKKCVIGAGSIVKGVFPDYSMIVGNPARVVKKWNFDLNRWEKI